jgi:hypothetical protein
VLKHKNTLNFFIEKIRQQSGAKGLSLWVEKEKDFQVEYVKFYLDMAYKRGWSSDEGEGAELMGGEGKRLPS